MLLRFPESSDFPTILSTDVYKRQALNTAELLRICRLLSNTARAKSYGRHDTQEDLADCLDIYFDGLEPVSYTHLRKNI